MPLTLGDYWMGRDRKYPRELTDTVRENAEVTVLLANQLLEAFGEDRAVNSGWRPAVINAMTPGAAKRSKHLTGEAIDLEDEDGYLDEWCFANEYVLVRIGLWLEHPAVTKNYCHAQIVPPRSQRRFFFP